MASRGPCSSRNSSSLPGGSWRGAGEQCRLPGTISESKRNAFDRTYDNDDDDDHDENDDFEDEDGHDDDYVDDDHGDDVRDVRF